MAANSVWPKQAVVQVDHLRWDPCQSLLWECPWNWTFSLSLSFPFSQNWGEPSKHGEFAMGTTAHFLVSAVMWDHKNLANSCLVTKVNGLDCVYTWGGNLWVWCCHFCWNFLDLNAPARRKRGGCARVPCPQWNPICSQIKPLNWSGFSTYSSYDHG